MPTARDKYDYYVEDSALHVPDRPRRFLEAFAAILEHGSYSLPLGVFARVGAKCNRCSASCRSLQGS